eukprot:SAG11_NODE_24582_length_371_cov_0.841912_1_plen_23_part_10
MSATAVVPCYGTSYPGSTISGNG